MLKRLRSQPRLLERYWSVLRRDRTAQPPGGLDPEIARVAARLAHVGSQIDASNTFADQLERRLTAEAGGSQSNARTWNEPAFRPQRPAAPSTKIAEHEERITMSDITSTQEPTTIPERRWTRELLKIAAAIAIFIVIGIVLALVLRDDEDEPVIVQPGPTATPAASATPAATQAGDPTATVAQPTATADASETAQPPTVTPLAPTATPPSPILDLPTGGSVAATIPVGQWPYRLASGAGSIWVANSNDGSVARIDPATNSVIATIQVASPGNNTADALAADDTSVWVYAAPQMLVRIDPATNQIVASITLDSAVDWLAIGHGAVWSLGFDANLLMRIDPATNTITASIPVEAPRDLVVTGDFVWVLRGLGRSDVLKIDPTTLAVVETISLEQAYGEFLRADGETLWVSTKDGLIQIDAATSQLVTTVPYPEPIFVAPMIAAGDGKVWVSPSAGQDAAIVWQFENNTGQWSAQIPVGTPAQGTWLLFSDEALWMSLSDENTVARITPAD